MFGTKIKISKGMMERIKEAADIAGYSSVEELVQNAIEKELERIAHSSLEMGNDEERIRSQLQGLGYID